MDEVEVLKVGGSLVQMQIFGLALAAIVVSPGFPKVHKCCITGLIFDVLKTKLCRSWTLLTLMGS